MIRKYNWLRWVAVLPGSIATYLLFYFLVRMMVSPERNGMYGIMDIIAPCSAGIGSAYCYIIAGAYIEPAHKKITAFILLILLILSAGASAYFQIQNKNYYRLIELVATIVGLFIAYKEFENKYPDSLLFFISSFVF